MANIKTKDFITLRSRKRSSGLEALYLDICFNGERKSEYLKLYLTGGKSREDKAKDKETMRIAETIRSQRVLELQNRRMGYDTLAPNTVLFYPFLDKVIESKSESTRNVYKCCRKKILSFAPDQNLTFADITPAWVSRFRNYVNSSPNSNYNTPHLLSENRKAGILRFLNVVLNQAVAEGIILSSPAKNIKKFRPNPKPRQFLTADELRQLRATPCADKELARAFFFSCLTGLRWSDIKDLKWKDLFYENGGVRLTLLQHKTGSQVSMNLEKQAISLLGKRGSDEDGIFNLTYSVSSYQNYINQWASDAGIKKHLTFHCARHSFATLMISQGVDIYTVSKLLGHSSVATTQIYAKVIDTHKREAMQKLPSFL